MDTYARILDGVVVEIIPPIEDIDISARFHPEYLANLVVIPPGVECGYIYDGAKFSPAPSVEPSPKHELRALDEQIIRGIDDICSALVAAKITLPAPLLDKIAARAALRSKLGSVG